MNKWIYLNIETKEVYTWTGSEWVTPDEETMSVIRNLYYKNLVTTESEYNPADYADMPDGTGIDIIENA